MSAVSPTTRLRVRSFMGSTHRPGAMAGLPSVSLPSALTAFCTAGQARHGAGLNQPTAILLREPGADRFEVFAVRLAADEPLHQLIFRRGEGPGFAIGDDLSIVEHDHAVGNLLRA